MDYEFFHFRSDIWYLNFFLADDDYEDDFQSSGWGFSLLFLIKNKGVKLRYILIKELM